MSLIIRETVVTECTGLARDVEVAVRNSTSNPLEDSVIERICETHVKKIVEDAGKQIEKQVEEREYQREDREKLQQSSEMYGSKRSDITEIVNVRIIKRDDPDNPDFHQLNGFLNNLRLSEDALNLDPDNAIEVNEIEPTANIDDVEEQDLLDHDTDSEFWEEYQTSYDVEVDQPFDKFYNCNQRIVKLLKTFCKDQQEIVKILGILSAHGDYSGTNNIHLLYELAQLMISTSSLSKKEKRNGNKKRRIHSPNHGEESSSTSSSTSSSQTSTSSSNSTTLSNSSSDDTVPIIPLEDRALEEKVDREEKWETDIAVFNIDQYGSYLQESTDSAELAIDEEKANEYGQGEEIKDIESKKRKRT